ncbi:MAG: hypothetical protein LBH40_03155 [Alphaproteobacteria bacterium]|jgi:hypothetical protein|nr:hypothetical protein [Alphaproteobacteria bacterium]
MNLRKNTSINFNKKLSDLIKENCLSNTPLKKKHFIASSLFILLHEIINKHNQNKHFIVLNSDSKIIINLDILDIICKYNDIGGSAELKKELKRIFESLDIIEFINKNYSSIININIQEDSISLDKKHFLIDGNFKIKENKLIRNYQYISYKKLNKFKQNIFKELYLETPQSVRTLLTTLTTGFLFAFSKKQIFTIDSISISEDVVITRVKQIQDKYLNYLKKLGAIKDFYYEIKNNCYLIAQDYIIKSKEILLYNYKTFSKKTKQIAIHIYKNNYLSNLIPNHLKIKTTY